MISGIRTSLSLWLASMFITVICVGNSGSIQQSIYIEGHVLTENLQPIPNVSVVLKQNQKIKTKTDADGHFALAVISGQNTLVFTHTSYDLFETTVNIHHDIDKRHYNIYLKEKRIELQEVIVSHHTLSSNQPIEKIKMEHKQIAGGTSVAVMTPEVQRLETIKDALKYEPGVVIQELFGANDQPRLSIRGSGIQSNPQRRGVYLLQDGIPTNFADGSFIIGVMDPAVSESIEVYKGANALRYGASTLGGAVNFNSRTGRHSPGIQVKAEAGSYGYGQLNAFLGDAWEDKDAFLSISTSRQDGFRQHNQNRKLNIAGNFGYRISPNIDNRTYLNYSYIHFDVPGPLTMSMLRDDPSQINTGIALPYYMGPNIARDKPGREAAVIRIANRTAFRLSAQTDLTASLYYQYIDDRFAFPIVLSTNRSFGNDYGLSIQTVHRRHNATLTAGLLASSGRIDRHGHINRDGLDSYMFSKDKLNALNLTLYTEYAHRFSDRFHLIGNLQAVTNERNSKDVFRNPELRPWYSHSSHKYRYFHSEDISLDQRYFAFNPRIGAIYNTGNNNDIQFFGNISRSYEPPTFDELVGTKVGSNINTSPKELFAVKLDKQSSYTAELGSRHEGTRYGWNISLYHSWVKNELLEVKDFVLGVKQTKNYPNTIHQGVEAGLMAVPIQGLLDVSGKDLLMLRAMYTFSNFYFNTGEYKGNKLAGVPPHYLTGSVEYSYPGKFFVSLNAESQPQKAPIDHSNTVYQPTYTVFGLRLGVEGWKNFSFYIDGKNILNKSYASSYVISDQILLPPIPFPQFTVDNLAFFMPGQKRAIYVGLSYTLK
ncbi:TonB-dependent receptor [Sphingobacterium sp. DN00404]|uniref:TonB-dependent receptor n=1 Tax=Sphingobacterium micropteri TaxID=2763501 RepID=A0ABR7YJA3_9SPHI|nr:TonB-dependent receptor [Sphingobacterium micropteri]MBD1431375.1 TonB-dependent receptor [Sphingobacterium micropteri]